MTRDLKKLHRKSPILNSQKQLAYAKSSVVLFSRQLHLFFYKFFLGGCVQHLHYKDLVQIQQGLNVLNKSENATHIFLHAFLPCISIINIVKHLFGYNFLISLLVKSFSAVLHTFQQVRDHRSDQSPPPPMLW